MVAVYSACLSCVVFGSISLLPHILLRYSKKYSGNGEDIYEENAKFVTESLQSRFDPTVA